MMALMSTQRVTLIGNIWRASLGLQIVRGSLRQMRLLIRSRSDQCGQIGMRSLSSLHRAVTILQMDSIHSPIIQWWLNGKRWKELTKN